MVSGKPVISIIMASYNHAAYIGEAIDSIRRQEGPSWELLIADDASSDRTQEVLRAYTGDPRIQLFPFTINRQAHMRNFAAERARGEYLAFLNSDDVFYPGKLRRQVDRLQADPSLAGVFTHVRCIDANSRPLQGHPLERLLAAPNQSRHAWLRQFFMAGNRLCLSSAMVRRTYFDRVGGFDRLLIQIGDLDLWIRLCLEGDVHVINEPLTGRRLLKDNLSNANPATFSRLFLETRRAFGHYFSPDGLAQAAAIFPELTGVMPEDTPAWRAYWLGRTACGHPQKAMRLLGFTQLQALLDDASVKSGLVDHYPRLLRTFFFSEGAAGLAQDGPDAQWTVEAADTTPIMAMPYCTPADGLGTVCFAFPNPQTPSTLRLVVRGPVLTKCTAVRLYEPRTGRLLFECGNMSRPVISGDSQTYALPAVDFRGCPSPWIDIEVDRVAWRTGRVNRFLRRKLQGLRRRLQKSIHSP